MAYAKGKNAWGISDRSGFRYKLREMKTEWNGLMVGPDEYERKHPQISPRPPKADPEAIKNASPDEPESLKVFVGIPTVMGPRLGPLRAVARVGTVEVSTP